MTHNTQEQALWQCEYVRSTMRDAANRAADADAAVEQFRKRYPADPIAPDQADNAAATTLITLLDDIAGDSAFSGFGQSIQSRIYAAVESLRKGQPAAPEPVWYDEPPLPKDGRHHACWVTGESHVQSVYWVTSGGWRYCQPFVKGPYPLHNRRVCPIVKPPEPTT